MKKILIIFIIFFTLHSKVFASVIYSQNDISSTVTMQNDSANIMATGYTPADNSTGTVNITALSPFYTNTAPITTLRVKRISGDTCGSALPVVTFFVSPWANPYVYSPTSANASGVYCDYTFSTPIPIATGLSYISYYSSTSSSSTIVLAGGTGNTGALRNGNNGFVSLGGFAFQLCDSGGCGSFTPPNVTTRIENILPIDNSTTSSTSVTISADYYLANPDTTQYISPPISIKARLKRTDTPETEHNYIFNTLTYNSLTSISHTFTLTTNATYSLTFDLVGNDYYFISPLNNAIKFNVVSDPKTGTNGYTTCDIANLAGCFQNAFVFLFYPDPDSLNNFHLLSDEIKNKAPIGYIIQIQAELKNINDTNTAPFALESIGALNTLVFTPIKAGLVWVLWVAFAFVLYNRLKDIEL